MALDSPSRRESSDKRPTFVPRHLRRSSSLLALECLVPSSPTLSASDTLCSVRSGEIPIILSFLTTNSVESINLNPDNVGTNARLVPISSLKPGVRELARFSPMAAFFPMTDANGSVHTTTRNDAQNSTHGSSPISQRLEANLNPSCTLLSSSYSTSSFDTSLEVEYRDVQGSGKPALLSAFGDTFSGKITSKVALEDSFALEKDTENKSTKVENCLKNSISFTITEPLEDIGNRTTFVTSSRSLSTIQFSSPHVSTAFSPSPSTPSFTPPLTPLSSISDKTPTQATFLQRRAAMHDKACSAFLQGNSSQQTSICQISEPMPPHRYELQIPNNQATSNSAEIKSPELVDNLPPHSPLYSLPVPCLKHAQWLRDSVVELWIDQEGFRAIRPRFFLASVSNGLPFGRERHGSLRNEDPLFTTVAEFLPVTREEHFFHHAALDRPPALHRITVNGQEGRDFITRQASLGLKESGVFYVQGTEDFKMTPPPGSGASRIVRLTWRFEYFVSSRKPGPRGKKMHQGEKVFKPLSFSCTPALLSPKRAIKVNVLHVMKKTLLPNLVAQKLDPPDLPIPPRTMETCHSTDSVVSTAISEAESSPLTATPERVRASIESRKVGMMPLNPVPIIGPPPRKSSIRGDGQKRYLNDDISSFAQERGRSVYKRHRARSASEQVERCPPAAEQFFAKTISIAALNGLGRPILPYDELSDLWFTKGDRNRHSIGTHIVNNERVTVLPPAPRPRLSGS